MKTKVIFSLFAALAVMAAAFAAACNKEPEPAVSPGPPAGDGNNSTTPNTTAPPPGS